MTLVPLSYKNFVKNKINNTVKIEYQDSDPTTYVYDNSVDSKSILNTQNYEDITAEEISVDTSTNITHVKNYIRSTLSREDFVDVKNQEAVDDSTSDNYANFYFNSKDSTLSNFTDMTNDNLKLFNFRNSYKIERVEQTFLPQSFELQKKNYVKNNLYKAYQNDFSLDFYNNLEFGFCNWNTINFFSQRYNTDINHTNCIIWPNTTLSTGTSNIKHQYDIIDNKNYNISFYFNLRKNYNTSPKPECVLHIPGTISIYFIKTNNNSTTYRIGLLLGESTKNNFSDIADISTSNNSSQLTNTGIYISSDLNILNNRWYNLSLNFFNKTASNKDVSLYIDGVEVFSENFSNFSSMGGLWPVENNFICIGNKPDYSNIDFTNAYNKRYAFDDFFISAFARKFGKDISLGKDNTWALSSNSLNDRINNGNFSGNINFKKSLTQNSESFHGEIHDIRIYKNTLTEEKIIHNCKNTINNVAEEISNYNLQFYVPVHYVPSYTNRKSSFNASADRVNLRYDNFYNPILANTCGGLEISCENYLIDFVKHTKPNVVIGGSLATRIYDDSIPDSINTLVSSTEDVSKIKKGVLTQSIYNYNFNNVESKRNLNLDSNLSYRNLLILPNDNGIQKVRFDAIVELLGDNGYDSSRYNINKFNSAKPFNISVENIFKNDSYYNKSMSIDASIVDDETIFERFLFDESDTRPREFKIRLFSTPLSEEDFILHEDLSYIVSNIIYHDVRFSNIENISILYDTDDSGNPVGNSFWSNTLYPDAKNLYSITESNPILRNYKQSLESTGINSNQLQDTNYSLEYDDSIKINYLKLPIPHTVINKDFDSLFINILDISSKMYNKSIKKSKFNISDSNISTSNSNLSLKFSDNGSGTLYRNDCLTEVATWNYTGHLFYKDGIISLNRPELFYFGENDFKCDFETDSALYVHEINIPVDSGLLDRSSNTSYSSDLRQDESAFNSEESFVYITDINLHDENLNVVARAKLARPAPKKKSDSILFRLKMDY